MLAAPVPMKGTGAIRNAPANGGEPPEAVPPRGQ
jgi:hypothetical protein